MDQTGGGISQFTMVHAIVTALVSVTVFLITYVVMLYKLKLRMAEAAAHVKDLYVTHKAFEACQAVSVTCKDNRNGFESGMDRSLLSIRAQLASNSLILARLAKALAVPEDDIAVIEKAVSKVMDNQFVQQKAVEHH